MGRERRADLDGAGLGPRGERVDAGDELLRIGIARAIRQALTGKARH